MNILNIIDTIYESKYFPTILLVSIIVLVVLFIAVIILGKRDAKKALHPKKENVQELKDITFETITEKEAIKEDVTFEIPVLTKNLENFKKSLEEEIEREEKINVIKKSSDKKEEVKQAKILDKEQIDNTDILPIINIDTVEEPVKEEVVEEVPKPPKREILKELFKDKKSKEVEPPKLTQEVKKEEKEQPKPIIVEKKLPVKEEPKKEKVEVVYKKEIKEPEKKPAPVKPEPKYSGDDDF